MSHEYAQPWREIKDPRSSMIMRGAILSGCVWWLIARLIGQELFEGYKGLDAVGAIATGIIIAYISVPVYRKSDWKHLFWLAPLSLYLAIALFGTISFLAKFLLIGPDVIGQSWSSDSGTTVHYEEPLGFIPLILGMWWGVTFTPYFLLLIPMSFLNHVIMLLLSGYSPFQPTRHSAPQG